ncbi:EamA family transporter [Aquicoccus sp. SCR17]|nr:EamA family transporter [Carideicomes alvinocaridis]
MPSATARRRNSLKAIGFLLASILCFDAMTILVRVMLAEGYSAQELSAYRNVLGALPSLGLMAWSGQLRLSREALWFPQWKIGVFRGAVVALAQILFYSALGYMELATAGALMQTQALFIVLLSVVVLSDRVGPWRWGAVAAGFGGAMWILRPGSDAFTLYAALPVMAAACYALSAVVLRRVDKAVSNALLYLYSSMTAALGAILLAAVTTQFSPVATPLDALRILAMALFGGTGVLFLMLAYRQAEPSLLAPFGYFGILTAFFFGWLFFGEAPVDTLFPGVLLIVGAGVVIMWRENRR